MARLADPDRRPDRHGPAGRPARRNDRGRLHERQPVSARRGCPRRPLRPSRDRGSPRRLPHRPLHPRGPGRRTRPDDPLARQRPRRRPDGRRYRGRPRRRRRARPPVPRELPLGGHRGHGRDHGPRPRRRRAHDLGPVPLRSARSRSSWSAAARTSPSAARTSTSTADRARRRSSTFAANSRTDSATRSRAGSGDATSSRWARATNRNRGSAAGSSGRRRSSAWRRSRKGSELSAEAGIEAIRAKGIALTEYAIRLTDSVLAPLGCVVGSPREAARRGAHVSIRHPDARRLCRELIDVGVIPDFREPDSIRLGLAPLYTRFVDVREGIDRLRILLERTA